jgi:hypothetical protein
MVNTGILCAVMLDTKVLSLLFPFSFLFFFLSGSSFLVPYYIYFCLILLISLFIPESGSFCLSETDFMIIFLSNPDFLGGCV